LYIQKQAGTEALPLEVSAALPTGARLQDVMLDGRPVDGLKFITDLRTDRQIEISYHLP
jgi:hypothetical protein